MFQMTRVLKTAAPQSGVWKIELEKILKFCLKVCEIDSKIPTMRIWKPVKFWVDPARSRAPEKFKKISKKLKEYFQ